MRTEWTKGPWKIRTNDHSFDVLTEDDKHAICTNYGCYSSTEQKKVDAHLIAAAPQLYEALHLWMDAFNSHLMSSSSKKAQARRAEMWDKANAAMAKARGESQ